MASRRVGRSIVQSMFLDIGQCANLGCEEDDLRLLEKKRTWECSTAL